MRAVCGGWLLSVALVAAGVAVPAAARPRLGGQLSVSPLGSFTPAAADPRRAAVPIRGFANGGFRFTPSAAVGGKRAVTVAVRARASGRAEAERVALVANPALAPTAYNLGVAVGWKRFVLSGDVARIEPGLLPDGREAADVSLSYTARRWSTRLLFGADRSTGDRPRIIGTDESYALDLGGAYAVTRNLDVTGGVRYKSQIDRVMSIGNERRDSQSVYLGTAFRF